MATADDRLRLLYDLTRQLATFTDLDDLVRDATRHVREVFAADGCSILLLDRGRGDFFFPIASQSEAHQDSAKRLEEIRFPADRGIAGWVLGNDEAIFLPDAPSDPRFYSGVDESTKLVTRSLLCAPLRTRTGNIGVIEVINPTQGSFTPEDREFLEALAGEIAVAYEKAHLYEQARREAIGLRQLCGAAGLGLVAVGVLGIAGALLAHAAAALPLGELAARPVVWAGIALAATGALLVAVSRGRVVPPHAPR